MLQRYLVLMEVGENASYCHFSIAATCYMFNLKGIGFESHAIGAGSLKYPL